MTFTVPATIKRMDAKTALPVPLVLTVVSRLLMALLPKLDVVHPLRPRLPPQRRALACCGGARPPLLTPARPIACRAPSLESVTLDTPSSAEPALLVGPTRGRGGHGR